MIVDNQHRQRIHRGIFFLGTGLFVLSYLFSIHVSNYALTLIFINWLAEGRYREKWKVVKTNKLLWLFSGLYILYVLSALYSVNQVLTLEQLERKSGIFVLPLIFATTRQIQWKHVRSILFLFVGSVSIALLICYGNAFYQIIFNQLHDALGVDYFHTILGVHRTYFGLSIAFSASILLNELHSEKQSTSVKLGLVLVLIFLLISLFLLASRMPILSLMLVFMFGLLFVIIDRKRSSVVTILSIIVVSLSGFAFGEQTSPSSIDRISSYKETSRLEMWKVGLEMIPEAIPFGYGVGDVNDIRNEKYLEHGLYKVYGLNYNFHNQYLETILQTGIPGITVLVLSFLIVFVLSLKKRKFLLTYFIILVGMGMLTESMFNTSKGVTFYTFFNALLVFHYLNKNEDINMS